MSAAAGAVWPFSDIAAAAMHAVEYALQAKSESG
jgi:hypothetical protein